MTNAIRELQRRLAGSPRAVDEFLATHEFPIVEGRSVTFVHRAAAEGVWLQHWIHGLPPRLPLQRLPGTDLWWVTIDLPERSRMEYKFEVRRGGRSQLVRDPLNPHEARDPFGANSVVHGHGYEVPEWTKPDPDARRGELRVVHVESRALNDRREVVVYEPARFRRTRRYPLLIVHDGQDYLRFANMQVVLDNLVHRLEIPPLVVAFTQSPDRMREYAADPRHERFVVDELLPRLEREYPLVPEPAARCLMGASFGAIASLSTAWLRPGVFGRLLLQSGSFLFTDIGEHEGGPVFDPVVRFMTEFRERPGRPADRVFLSCGIYEPMIYYNRSLVPLLQNTGMEVRFVEARDGHNWENWRDRLREGLSWSLPGPLWMVYE